jgi:hypothetical protein
MSNKSEGDAGMTPRAAETSLNPKLQEKAMRKNHEYKGLDIVELFNQFWPKFREVKIQPDRLGVREYVRDCLVIAPVRDACIPGFGEDAGLLPYVSLRELKKPLKIEFIYDSKVGREFEQFSLDALWKALYDEYFAGLTFYADYSVDGLATKDFLLRDPKVGYLCSPRATLSCNKGKVPLLKEARFIIHHWSFFVPKESHEGKILKAAIDLELARKALQEEGRRVSDLKQKTTELHKLEERLQEALHAPHGDK